MEFTKNYTWTKDSYNNFLDYLISLADQDYKVFSSRITNTKYEILGIRVPILRNVVKKLSKTNINSFLSCVNSENFEVLFIEGLLLTYLPFEDIKERLKLYTYKIDNWAITDMVSNSLKINDKNKKEYFKLIKTFINDKYEFTKRFGIVTLLSHFVLEDYLDYIFKIIKNNKSNDYYVNMAYAWLLCECFIKFRDKTLIFIEENELNTFVLRKGISKINDSYRVSIEDKMYLKKLLKSKVQ